MGEQHALQSGGPVWFELTFSVEELSQRFSISVPRVRQLEQQALQRLQRHRRRLVEFWE